MLDIQDVNDEAPVFNQSSYEFSLAEHQPVGVFVGHVTAADRDAPPFNRFVYQLVDAYETGADEMFSIDPRSGRIISTVSFDREQIDEYEYFSVISIIYLFVYFKNTNTLVNC